MKISTLGKILAPMCGGWRADREGDAMHMSTSVRIERLNPLFALS
jgi:hypothetical protein